MRALSFLFFAAVLLASGTLSAEVRLGCLFADHMVFEDSGSTRVWGTANPGEPVKVTLANKTAETRAGGDGRWQVTLDLHRLAGGPYELMVLGSNRIVLHDVLVGEVWLASGQSNMEFELSGSAGAAAEIAHSENPQVRQFRVVKSGALDPLDTCNGRWVAASPSTAGDFSAIGYYFAKKLQQELRRPVGLVSSFYGGSIIEAWLSPDLIVRLPDLEAHAQSMIEEERTYAKRLEKYQRDYRDWQARYSREDPEQSDGRQIGIEFEGGNWRQIRIGSSFTESALSDGGAVWLRKRVEVTPEMVGSYLPLHLGALGEFDQVYWNGVRIGETTADGSDSMNDGPRSSLYRRYNVPGSLMKVGEATLAIRIFNPVRPPSVDGMAHDPTLAGEWAEKIEFAEPWVDPEAKATFPHRPLVPTSERNMPTALFNGMIHPVIPYAIRGVIWMQGEGNVGRAYQYRAEFPAMIQDWRSKWGEGDFPFYFCQLANFGAKTEQPRESALAELREAQTMALMLPRTGEAITIDIGEADDIHFRDKQTAGMRLARIALSQTYGRKSASSGPEYRSSKRQGTSIRVRFRFADGGLKAAPLPLAYKLKSTDANSLPLVRNRPDSQLEGFQICGVDRKWVWADARIEGSTVRVSSPQVHEPVAVRYGWADNPTVNLYNGEGLPAVPFRTDDYPDSTRDARF